MARGTPFIVPVSVDATSERGALVPAAFLAVQWMRLKSDAVLGELAARVGQLLGGEEAVGLVGGENTGWKARGTAEGMGTGWKARGTAERTGRRVSLGWWGAVIGVGVLALGVFWWRHSPVGAKAGGESRASGAEKATEPRRGAKSIAVLPFENLSEDKEASLFFSDGMHQDVITNLLLIRDLACVPHTTVMSYRGTKKTHREIAEELGVADSARSCANAQANADAAVIINCGATTTSPSWACSA